MQCDDAGRAGRSGFANGSACTPQKVGGCAAHRQEPRARIRPRLVEAFPGRGQTITLGKPTLEDVFIERTGHRFWDEEAAMTDDGRHGLPKRRTRPSAGGTRGDLVAVRRLLAAGLVALLPRAGCASCGSERESSARFGQPFIFWVLFGAGLGGTFHSAGRRPPG